MRSIRLWTAASIAACVMALLGAQSAQAQTLKVLYNFHGSDGANPYAGVIRDKGNLYGAAFDGGTYGWGTVFMLSSTDAFTVLYSFTGDPDGAGPGASLIRDTEGNLYGTTEGGGASKAGTVFKLSKTGKETVLYSFCSLSGCSDGDQPEVVQLIQDAKGTLYGTTTYGGAYGYGTVFKLSKTGKETVLYSFCPGGKPCLDGANPPAGVIRDVQGNLYGTTGSGGDANCVCGVVFKLDKTGKFFTVLYSFKGMTDGAEPNASVIRDAKGNLYGTTLARGAYNYGTVFRLSKAGQQTTLHSFAGRQDGYAPAAGVIRDAKGNLYGTTQYGGGSNAGTIFKLSKTGKETVLYTFTGGTDGGKPFAGVIQDSKGNLYGTTYQGGASNDGTVFKLTP